MRRVVIIPTAKNLLVSSATGDLPPIIQPVNNNMVIDEVMRCYGNADYRLVCYDSLEKVVSTLSGYDVQIIPMDEIKDLSMTISKGIVDGDTEVIINYGDTIVWDLIPSGGDWIFYSKGVPSNKWTFFKEKNGRITDIYDKVINPQSDSLFVGVFGISDAMKLKEIMAEHTQWSFYDLLAEYSKGHPFVFIEASSWYDVGHIDTYRNTKMMVQSRSFNEMTLDRDRGIMTKASSDPIKFKGEIEWFLKLPSGLTFCCPRIFGYSLDYDKPWVSMEYYPYHTLHELFLFGDMPYEKWSIVFRRIAFLLEEFSRYRVNDRKAITSALNEIYIEKTRSRMGKMASMTSLALFMDNPVTVNGVRYVSINRLWEKVKKEVELKLLGVDYFTIIHGDLCFPNMLIDDDLNLIRLIDPRGRFGCFDIYGDPRYDYAKLLHSVEGGYDYIIKDLFTVECEGSSIRFRSNMKRSSAYDAFMDVVSYRIEDMDSVRLIEGLLFLTMIPLHKESPKRNHAMLATAYLIFDGIMDIREDDR
mgnify:CR=1 FL=1